jgi:hypothetical protein
MFACVHELLDHLVSPQVVKWIIKLIPDASSRVQTAHTWIVGVELAASLAGPLLAFVFASEGCLLRYVIPSATSPTTTIVERTYCALTAAASDGEECLQNSTVAAAVSYVAPFEFSGERCVSSVITIYTPAYLYLIGLRLLLLYPLWWIRRHPTWKKLVTPSLPNELDAVREQVEDNTFGINTLAIGLCGGMASPFVAAAALVCQLAKHVMYAQLNSAPPSSSVTEALPMSTLNSGTVSNTDMLTERLIEPVDSTDAGAYGAEVAGEDEIVFSRPPGPGTGPLNAEASTRPFVLPSGSIFLVLVITVLYFVLFSVAAGLPWWGLGISVLCVTGFGTVWRQHRVQ